MWISRGKKNKPTKNPPDLPSQLSEVLKEQLQPKARRGFAIDFIGRKNHPLQNHPQRSQGMKCPTFHKGTRPLTQHGSRFHHNRERLVPLFVKDEAKASIHTYVAFSNKCSYLKGIFWAIFSFLKDFTAHHPRIEPFLSPNYSHTTTHRGHVFQKAPNVLAI